MTTCEGDTDPLEEVTYLPEGVDVDLDTADTRRFDLPFAEEKLNWIKQHTEVDDTVKALERSSVRVCHGHIVTCTHLSKILNCHVSFKIFLPALSQLASVPQLYFLPGAECEAELSAFMFKKAAFWGIALIVANCPTKIVPIADPDSEASAEPCETSSLFGSDSNFWYVDVPTVNSVGEEQQTTKDGAPRCRMFSYVLNELRVVVTANFAVRYDAMSVMGYKTGGHGALLMGLRNPEVFKSISAVAPLPCPSQDSVWGPKLVDLLGNKSDPLDKIATNVWKRWDVLQFLKSDFHVPPDIALSPILVDCPDSTSDSAKQRVQKLQEIKSALPENSFIFRLHEGYDDSIYFLHTTVDVHVDHHARFLCPEKFASRSAPQTNA